MTTQAFVDTLREEFTTQLGRTGAYTKLGMQLAFEKAMTAALVRFTESRPALGDLVRDRARPDVSASADAMGVQRSSEVPGDGLGVPRGGR